MEKYKVLRKVGTGAYGSAYLVCLKEHAQQQYVLKKVQPQDASEMQKQQAQNEVELLAKLNHPFVLGCVPAPIWGLTAADQTAFWFDSPLNWLCSYTIACNLLCTENSTKAQENVAPG